MRFASSRTRSSSSPLVLPPCPIGSHWSGIDTCGSAKRPDAAMASSARNDRAVQRRSSLLHARSRRLGSHLPFVMLWQSSSVTARKSKSTRSLEPPDTARARSSPKKPRARTTQQSQRPRSYGTPSGTGIRRQFQALTHRSPTVPLSRGFLACARASGTVGPVGRRWKGCSVRNAAS